MPRFRMVSIIPGIETTAPDRTETSKGRSAAPSRRPVRSSSRASPSAICSANPSGQEPPAAIASTQATVVTVKASGTGTPIRRISATPAPLPPNNDFIDASPSARS